MANTSYDLTLAPPARTVHLIEEMQERASQPEIQDVVAVLELDPITTAHLLRQVNSPYYSLRQSVASLDRAATMLGFDAIANVVFIETHIPLPEELSTPKARLVYEYLIRTSAAASRVADVLAHHFKMEQHGAVRTAALIHQLGRLSLFSMHSNKYVPMWKEATSPSGMAVALPPGIGREIVHFRADYTRHGEQLAREWGLPPYLSESIRHHADPERIDDTDRSSGLTVAVSQYAARSLFEPQEDLERDQGRERIEKATSELAMAFELPRKRLDALLNDAKRSAYEEAISIDL